MRVAVWLVDTSETAGGGLTFQREVAESLAASAGQTRHQLVFFCSPSFELGAIESSGVAVRRVRETRLERARDLLRRESRIAETLLDGSAADDVLDEEKIEFVLNLTQYRIHTDIPYSVIVWDLQHRRQPWFPEVSERGEWSNREATYRWLLPRAAFVICGNRTGADEIEQFYRVPREHIRLLSHPTPRFALEAPAHDATVAARYGLTRPFLLYPAQFWPHKNHVNLLHALERVSDLDLDLALVGSDQGNAAFVREVADSLGLSSRTHVLGFIPNADLCALYREALALTYVTFFGPENLPPLEAFAFGCPVIASNVAGAEEQIGDAALLVNPRSPDEIAAAVRRVHDDATLRAALIERGRARALQWTGSDFARGLFQLLDEFEPVRRNWPPGRFRSRTR
jgi:glycosyltransferase involved in cell wall biosynthesis